MFELSSRRLLIIVGWGVLLTGAPWSGAQAQDRLSGLADVSAAQTTIGGIDQSTVRQRYSARLGHRFTEILRTELSLYYSRFDVDGAEILGSFQEEVQPGAQLTWTPRGLRFQATGRRRIASSPITTGDLITDDLLLDMQTDIERWPTFRLSYRRRDTEDTQQEAVRDIFESNALASVNWLLGPTNLFYEVNIRETTNQISDRSSDEISQVFRYGSRQALGDHFRLDSEYYYRRRDQTSEALTGQTLLDPVDADQGLYARDPDPTFGELEAAAGLLDGNTQLPTDPAIDIGAGQIDQNIGVDLGFTRPISGVDVYTDRLSGTAVAWEVYVSEDNLQWERHDAFPPAGLPPVVYNAALLRFELRFGTVETRYLKVVARGGNTVSPVLVTELEIFEALADVTELEREDSSHRADLGLTYRPNDEWRMSVRGSANLEPSRGSLSDRNDLSYILRTTWDPTASLQHDVQWQQFWRTFDGFGEDLREDRAGYSLSYDPLATLRTDLGLSARFIDTEGERSEERYSALLGASLEPWSVLRGTVRATTSRLRRPINDSGVDTWRLQARTDVALTRTLDVALDGTYQESTLDPEDRLLVRRTAAVEWTLRPFPSTLARGSLRWIQDQRFTRSYDLLLSWNVAERFNLVGQTRIDEGGLESRVDQLSVNYVISSRARLYLQYSKVDRDGDDQDIDSFRQGYRQSF